MLLRHSLVGSDIAEHPVLLLIVSSHAATTNTSRCGLGVIFQQPASHLDFSLLCLAAIWRLFVFIETTQRCRSMLPPPGDWRHINLRPLRYCTAKRRAAGVKSLSPLVRRHLTLTDSLYMPSSLETP